MRLACYGFVEKKSGSVASANFYMLKGLLERGHTIDFYAKSNFVYPEELLEYPGFQYIGYEPELENQIIKHTPDAIYQKLSWPISRAFYNYSLRKLEQLLRKRHQQKPYDALLFLGTWAPFHIPDLPTLSWPQGHPATELKAIQNNRKQIIDLCGYPLYLKLLTYYTYYKFNVSRQTSNNTVIIVNNSWNKATLVQQGFPAHRIHCLPYPIDTEYFQPVYSPHPQNPPHLLWLGRIDPRKRLDLMLEAFARLIASGVEAHLSIIGRFTYAPAYKKLIDQFPYPEHLTYHPGIPREQVPTLFHHTDILVQPSEYENFGSSVAEAQSCGVPVVLGPTNGTGEYIDAAKFLFKEYTSESLFETLREALEVIQSQKALLARQARQTAETQFSHVQVIDQLEQIIFQMRELSPDHVLPI